MTAVIAEHDVTVLLGDVREQLATLADGSVQCIVTSPPYYGLRDYGHDGQIGLEPSPAEYVESMRAVFADVRRVLAADGVLWLNIGDSYYSGKGSPTQPDTKNVARRPQSRVLDMPGREWAKPKDLLGIPWRVAFALQDDGWTCRADIIWHKPNAMPESVTDRPSTRYEHVFLFSKSRRYSFDLDAIREPHAAPLHKPGNKFGEQRAVGPMARGGHSQWEAAAQDRSWGADGGRNPGDVWTIPTSPFPGAHFACMPPELARRCILAGCPDGGTVLDPFAGSGTTLKVARSLGRKSVGIELNPAYIDIIRDRIGQSTLDFGEAS